MQMKRINFLPLGFLGLLLAGPLPAADLSFTGEYQGTGRQCFGRLSVQSKSIEWHTPFATCRKTPYRVLAKEPRGSGQEVVFVLQGKPCGFGVIALSLDSEEPQYWNVSGYRSMAAYENNSEDRLLCSVERLSGRVGR